MADAGVAKAKIARDLGVSRMTVYRALPDAKTLDEAALAAMALVVGVAGYRECCTFWDLANLFDDWGFSNVK